VVRVCIFGVIAFEHAINFGEREFGVENPASLVVLWSCRVVTYRGISLVRFGHARGSTFKLCRLYSYYLAVRPRASCQPVFLDVLK
jgi:hypothetical protein